MIVGIGVDLVEVERMAKKVLKKDFREKIFSKGEIAFCESNGKMSVQHFAARFAAKEAFLKATGKGMTLTYDLNEIEVVSSEGGKPEIQLSGRLAEMARNSTWKIHVTLTHIPSYACAFIVIESNQ